VIQLVPARLQIISGWWGWAIKTHFRDIQSATGGQFSKRALRTFGSQKSWEDDLEPHRLDAGLLKGRARSIKIYVVRLGFSENPRFAVSIYGA